MSRALVMMVGALFSRVSVVVLAFATTALGGVGAAAAQAPVPFTGYELAVGGADVVRADRPARFHGTAYRVRGLAELVPFAGRVRARFAGSEDDVRSRWVAVRSNADGGFEIEVPIPPIDDTHEAPRVQLAVGADDDARVFDVPVTVQSALSIMLKSDRKLYEPGEPAHVWMLITDAATGRPAARQRVQLTIDGGALPRTVRALTTEQSGVAHVELPIPESAPHGAVYFVAEVEGQLSAGGNFSVGTRTWERLLATVEMADDQVPPEGVTNALVHVTTPSGAPVSGAEVALQVGSTEYSGVTDDDGRAAIRVTAPAYHTHDTGAVSVRAGVVHPAHGSTMAVTTLTLAVPLTLAVEVYARNGGLVPEVDDVVYVRLRDGAGDPPPVGTELTIEGPAFRAGTRVFSTDEHGFAEIPLRVPLGAASGSDGVAETPILVRVRGALERTANLVLPVFRDAELGVSLDRVIAEPGGSVDVRVARRPSAARAEVVVELVDSIGAPLVVTRLGARQSSARLTLPADRLGLFSIVARALREDETFEGPGTWAGLIVRPPQPSFISLTPERRRWVVGETARVRLDTTPGAVASYGAVLVRDLSAHAGEEPFARSYLEGAFDRAILDPATPNAERLLRAAMAAHSGAEAEPMRAPPLVDALGLAPEESYAASSNGPLRDPFPLSRELLRRGVGEAMTVIENRLRAALDAGALDDVTTGSGSARRFDDDLLAGEDGVRTLGGGEVKPSLISAADPSFTYDNVARRVARERLVRIMVALAGYLDPGDEASPAARMASREPSERWLPRMVERGLLAPTDLDDPWGGRFQLRRAGSPALVLSARAAGLELVSPGPDGRPGTRDDVRDPFARAVPAATPYALASGEDELMRALAVLSPLNATLRMISEAYRRVSAEMQEEEIGDAVSAEVSEGAFGFGGLGVIGTGGGGGGVGYGSGAGGFGRRTARAPRVRTGHASVSNLAGIVRERFPPTLLFIPDLVLDDSGATEITIPLADTVTTYIVEAIVWREDGWVWSESTRIEVDREIVVDAPIPATAHRGDVVRLPLRISNRGERSREVVLRLLGDDGLGVPDSEPHPLTLAPGEAGVVPIEVELSTVGAGQLTVVATTPDGEAVDAVRRPIEVVELARRVTMEREHLGDGEAVVTFQVPRGADPRAASLWIGAGPVVFGDDNPDSPWASWSSPTAGREGTPQVVHDSRSPVHQAFWIGSVWADGATDDARVSEEALGLTNRLEMVTRRLEADEEKLPQRLRLEAWTLLGLAPIAAAPEARTVTEPEELVERLRGTVAELAMSTADDPEGWVLAAAALGMSPGDGGRAAVVELIRRSRRHAVTVGEDRWLATEHRAVRSTLLWAMAELSLGHRDDALSLLSTVGRWSALGNTLSSDERGLASAVMTRLLNGETPRSVEVIIDGRRRVVDLQDGGANVEAPELARPGRHRVVARSVRGALVQVSTSVRYGIGWRHAPAERGPLDVAIEGEPGGVEEVAELELVVRNRTPRTLPQPIVEVELPTGAELTAAARRHLARRARSVHVARGVLRVSLAPMPPGREERMPLALRWSVDGHLRGLGIAGWAEDRPGAVTVEAPRTLRLRPRSGSASRSER